jgi:hypothetical protein
VRAHAARERHFDEDDGLVGQLRVEEGEAAPVGLEPAAQLAPALDGVHRLVLDQLLQHERRGPPVDALEAQEAAVEPLAQQVQQVRVDDAPLGACLQLLQELRAHRYQSRRSARRHVQPPEELPAQRLDRLLQPRQVVRRRIGLVRRCAMADRLGRRRVIACQRFEELRPVALVERLESLERFAREGSARVLAAHGEKRVAQAEEMLHGAVHAAATADEPPQEGRHAHALPVCRFIRR